MESGREGENMISSGQKTAYSGPYPGHAGSEVFIRVTDIFDVFLAQQVARALSRSLGLDAEETFMVVAETSQKGGGLLGPEAGNDLLVLDTQSSGGKKTISVGTAYSAQVFPGPRLGENSRVAARAPKSRPQPDPRTCA
ncbi:MAG TPA: hypothetical protein DEB40_05170 [Elusimicrobia bacterium]|nr:hypothetical protein [Elusimicrobiota bacterium]HBT61115.1 hypothetical protein [Elusimicrobiota bacterium]